MEPRQRANSFRFMNRVANPPTMLLLRSPLGRWLGGGMLVLEITGRRSGRRFRLPVQFARSGPVAWVLVARAGEKRWWRNLRGGAPVTVFHRGRTCAGHATAVEGARDAVAAAAGLATYLASQPRARKAVGLHGTSPINAADDSTRKAAARCVLVRIEIEDWRADV